MNEYHKRFLNSFANESIIGIFSRCRNAHKEITESWAMLEAAKKYVPDLNTYTTYVIGDGGTPRTGALMAYFTKSYVYSMDPAINLEHYNKWFRNQVAVGDTTQRFEVFKETSEDFVKREKIVKDRILVLWPHSHANMNSFPSVHDKRFDIAMPCCVKIPSNLARIPHIVYEDANVLSPERTIHVWES